jgi:hypothetical protein
VVFASDEAIDAFHAAAEPTIAAMREDPLTAKLIDAITELKSVTLPSAGVVACDPPVGTALYPLTDPEGYLATLPPPGAYRADVTYEGMVASGTKDRWARLNQGLSTFTFTEDTVTFEAMNPDGRHFCSASLEVTADGRAVRLTDHPGGSCGIGMDILWKPDGDGIRMIASMEPGARGTPGQIEEFINWRGWLESFRWVKVQ